MTTQTLTLAAFLLARIAEDEAVARSARDGHDPLDWSAERDLPALGMADSDGPSGYGVVIIDPARVLAECAAKRAIVALHWSYADDDGRDSCDCMQAVPCPTLRALASVYSDHPDYDPSWA